MSSFKCTRKTQNCKCQCERNEYTNKHLLKDAEERDFSERTDRHLQKDQKDRYFQIDTFSHIDRHLQNDAEWMNFSEKN